MTSILLLLLRYYSFFSSILTFATTFGASIAAEVVEPDVSFTLPLFGDNSTLDSSSMTIGGDATFSNSSIKIASDGWILYNKPARFLGRDPGFSTSFSFSIDADTVLTFFMLPGGDDARIPSMSSALLEVNFETVTSTEPEFNTINNFGYNKSIKIALVPDKEILAAASVQSSSHPSPGAGGMRIIHAWIEYDGESKMMRTRFIPRHYLGSTNAIESLNSTSSYHVDLSNALQMQPVLVGLFYCSKSTHNSSTSTPHSSFLYSWSFTTINGAPSLLHSEPMDPLRGRPFVINTMEEVGPSKHGLELARSRRVISDVVAWFLALSALMALMVLTACFVVKYFSPVAPVEVDVFSYDKVVPVGDKEDIATSSSLNLINPTKLNVVHAI